MLIHVLAPTRAEAGEALSSVIDEVRLQPRNGTLASGFYAGLGANLVFTNDKAASGQARRGHSTVLVAGAGFTAIAGARR